MDTKQVTEGKKTDVIEEKLSGPLTALWDITLFSYALMAITVFLVFVLILMIFGIPVYYAFAPALGLVVVAYLRFRGRYDPVREIEKGNIGLKERLSAAYDNREKGNVIVRDLVREVSYYLDNINTSAFLDRERTNTYVIVSIIIVFILLSLMFMGLEGFGGGGLFGGGGGTGGSGSGASGSGGGGGGSGGQGAAGESPASQEMQIGAGSNQDIFGDSSIAQIEGQDLELEIHPEYGETQEFDFEEPQGGNAGQGMAEGYIQATAAESYTENIPVALESAVRNYFEQLAED